MADLVVDGSDLLVRLSPLEKLGALHGSVRLPLATVTTVRATDDAWSALRGIRAPGTGIPRLISLCTRRGPGFRDFAAVYRNRPAVVVETSGGTFDRVVVSCADAADTARRIDDVLPDHRAAVPGHRADRGHAEPSSS